MPEITLDPGSPSERVARHLLANPTAVLTRQAVAELLTIAPGAVDAAVRPGTNLGLITCFNDGDEGRCWRAGPRLKAWARPGDAGKGEAPAAQAEPVAAAPAPAAEQAPKARRGASKQLPPLQVAALKVATGVPLPVNQGRSAKGKTKYDEQLDLLKADGTCVLGIPLVYKSALNKAVSSYLTNRPALKASSVLLVRQVDSKTVGVWRLAKGAPGAERAGQQAAGRASRAA